MLRKRVSGPGAAFLIGAAAGASFAIMEDYFCIGGALSSSQWLPVVADRSMSAVLHPLAAGILSLAVYSALRGVPGSKVRLVMTYFGVVGLHGAWNFLSAMLASASLEQFLVRSVESAGPESLLAGFATTAAVAIVFSPLITLYWWLATVTTGNLHSVESHGEAKPTDIKAPGGRFAAMWPTAKFIYLIEVLTPIPAATENHGANSQSPTNGKFLLVPASFKRRAVGLAIDLAVFVLIPVGMWVQGISVEEEVSLLPPVLISVALYVLILIGAKRTLGKFVTGIELVESGRHEISRARVLIGVILARPIAGIWAGVGMIWAAWDPKRQGWHDLLAGTQVVEVHLVERRLEDQPGHTKSGQIQSG